MQIESFIAPQPPPPTADNIHFDPPLSQPLKHQTAVVGSLFGPNHRINDKPATIYAAVINGLLHRQTPKSDVEVEEFAKLAVRLTSKLIDEMNREIAIRSA